MTPATTPAMPRTMPATPTASRHAVSATVSATFAAAPVAAAGVPRFAIPSPIRLLLACLLALAQALALLCPSAPALAGTPCEAKLTDAASFVKAIKLAEASLHALDDSGAQVALIARAGQNLSQYGLRYSHMAYVWRDHPQGRWLVVHELNQCGTASSGLYNEGLGNFFLDNMFAYETVILVPGAATQARLAAMLSSGAAVQLHAERYNMLAYPYSTEYQNSNQWLLETYAAAMAESPVRERAQAQAWLRLANYRPITIEIPAMTRLGARLFRANVAFDDQPFDRRMAGHIDTVTVDSVLRFLHEREPDARAITLRVN